VGKTRSVRECLVAMYLFTKGLVRIDCETTLWEEFRMWSPIEHGILNIEEALTVLPSCDPRFPEDEIRNGLAKIKEGLRKRKWGLVKEGRNMIYETLASAYKDEMKEIVEQAGLRD